VALWLGFTALDPEEEAEIDDDILGDDHNDDIKEAIAGIVIGSFFAALLMAVLFFAAFKGAAPVEGSPIDEPVYVSGEPGYPVAAAPALGSTYAPVYY
jgi:hypothetical protein